MAQSKETPSQAQAEADLYFGPFRLEQAKRLWRGEQVLEVRPRPLAVLRYLAERPGQLVTGAELLKRLWPGIYVTKTVLRVCIREVRQALNEDPIAPQFIETVGRQGYRFVGTVQSHASSVHSPEAQTARQDARAPSFPASSLQPPASVFIGREQELARLHELFARAQRGERQTMFLFGEPGIGKTTLVDRFLARVQESGRVRIGRGQCVEQHGPGEAYLPLLEALGEVCREPGGEQVLRVLRRHAPLWVVQLGGLLEASEREALQRQVQGSSRERMLRELAEAVEALAADTALVVVVEDLQWSDAATLEAMAYLAQRQRSVRLYMLGTYRPAEVVVQGHALLPVVQELYGRRQCEELALELLTEAEVEEYLRQRLGQSAVAPALRQLIYHRTDGNALFMVCFVDYLLQQELLVQVGSQIEVRADLMALTQLVPDTLQQVILRQIEQLAVEEQQLLEVASVGGRTFTAAEVAGVSGRRLEEVEEVCDQLAARERLVAVVGIVEWPDGTVTVRYKFRHALYQQVLYEQLGQAWRVRLHRQLGEQKELGYGERVAEIASELAVHFTVGRDYRRAVRYHSQAGEIALRRSAYGEANAHCQEGLKLLERLPDTPERQRQELALRMLVYTALTVTQGFVAEEVVRNLTRARELCRALNDDATLVSVLVGLGRSYHMRADRDATEQLMEEERHLLERIQEPRLALQLHSHLGTSSMARGALVQAQQHHARVLELYNPQWHRELVLHFGVDPAVGAGVVSGWSLWLAGWPDQARARSKQGLSRARELGHPFSLAFALIDTARVQLWCGNLDEAERLAEEGVSLAREHGVAWFIRAGGMLQDHIRVQRGGPEAGLSTLTERVSQYRSTGVLSLLPLHLSSVADACRRLGRVEEGLVTVAEALHVTETSTPSFWAAELHRLKGELTLAQSSVQRLASRVQTEQKTKSKGQKGSGVQRLASRVSNPRSALRNPQSEAETEAEQCFHKAIEIARQQEAKSLELRAAMSLSQLWQHQGKRAEARTLLAETYSWFSEGFDTADLRAAKALLDALRA